MANQLSEETMRKEVENYLSNRKISGQVLSVQQVFDDKNPDSDQIQFTYRGAAPGSENPLVKQETLILKNNKFVGIK